MMRVPTAFAHPLYYSESQEIESGRFDWENSLTVPFKYDMAYALGLAPSNLPWEHQSQTVPLLFHLWKEIEAKLNMLHEKRERSDVKAHVVGGIALLLQAIFWMNKLPVRSLADWEKEILQLHVIPVNIVERLDFVMKKPEMYHAFIQLQQLFTESSKLFYKLQAIPKR
ncbi:MAG: YpoC family protein [Bacillota bacterium]